MLEKLNFFLDNWYILILFLCALVVAVVRIIEFIGYPTEKKKQEIKNRLLYYVDLAEKELGSGTGQIKLSQVYDVFCELFPYTKKWFTLEKFNDLISEILPIVEGLLKKEDISE